MTTEDRRCGTCKYIEWRQSDKGRPLTSQPAACGYVVQYPQLPECMLNHRGERGFYECRAVVFAWSATKCKCWEHRSKKTGK